MPSWTLETLGTCAPGRHALATPRLFLRTATLADALPLLAAGSDREAQRGLGWPARQIVPAWRRRRALRWRMAMRPVSDGAPAVPLPNLYVALDRERPRLAGALGISPIGEDAGIAGGWMAPAYREGDLFGDLVDAWRELAHHHLGLLEVRSAVTPDNVEGVEAVRRTGFAAGESEVLTLEDGRTVPVVWYVSSVTSPVRCAAGRGPDWKGTSPWTTGAVPPAQASQGCGRP
ncbi:GNAT family N-acetyltransferase [Actinomadura nitritigenes]|uniref:GNAT family N-acetyltransferase n=1 Tax=Actinomadura nitritigenes TaxID=134602 RepID=UPI003D8C8026